MKRKLSELAALVGGVVKGDPQVVITGLSGIKEAGEGDLTFLANPKYFPLLEKTRATAVLVSPNQGYAKIPAIEVENPSLAFATIASELFVDQAQIPRGVHPSAVIAPDVRLGKDVAVGPLTIIESGVQIADNTIIYGLCYIGHQTKIGKDCTIYPQITIRERVVMGDRVLVHSGTVIGSDGFGFVTVKGANVKIPQIGTVEIGDDVEIGANVTIDRARFDKTIIGRGTKIDNLVQIAHNVRIGENCIIVSQAGISGSTVLEDHVTLAGQAGLVGHITIGKNSIVAAQSGVPNSVPPDTVVWGFPAKPIQEAKRVNAAVQRLPHYVHVIQDLKKRMEELELKLKELQRP